MEINKFKAEGLIEVKPRIFKDERGIFFEPYNKASFIDAGIDRNFVQDNQSFSIKGVVRGLHFQKPPFAQAKLVRVVVGKVLDVVVDIRKSSPTFGLVETFILDSESQNTLFIPEGFAHGFSALTDCIFLYKVSNFYNKESESGILYNDKTLNIDWGVANPIVSDKDLVLPSFDNSYRFE